MQYEHERWLSWNQPANILMITLPLEAGVYRAKEFFGQNWPLTILYFEGDQVVWFNRWEELRSLGEKILDSWLLPGASEQFFTGFEQECKTMRRAVQDMVQLLESSDPPHAVLADHYRAFVDKYLRWYAIGWCAEPVQFCAERILVRELERLVALGHIEGEKVISGKIHLFSPTAMTYQAKMEISFAACVETVLAALRRAGWSIADDMPFSREEPFITWSAVLNDPIYDDARRMCQAHAAEFYWSRNNYLNTCKLTGPDVLDEVGKALKDRPPQAIRKGVADLEGMFTRENPSRRELKQNLGAYHRAIVDILGSNALLKDRRKEVISRVNHVLTLFLERIAADFSITLGQAQQMLSAEIEEVLSQGRISEALCETLTMRREKAVVIWCEHDVAPIEYTSLRRLRDSGQDRYPPLTEWTMGGPTIVEGAAAANDMLAALNGKFGFVLDLEKRVTSSRIKGDCVFFNPGEFEIKGTARIVLDPKVPGNFEKGDVLIAPSTTPDYLALMKKAACIVTDWGGWTSHAALVAREFGKPCIVGTNYATKIFADGDQVAVILPDGIIEKSLLEEPA
ncbi:PEP-utilizing enzyme [Magnetospirillum sulfuroxidans]|uniref:PEP-utilising enzyme mobile domain-containing protein n=1 Tax=Magnetospirillum sulfuroxidans TaxID=611300 RepID=A0ABS5ICA9_9PROT|nr:PEP-utilizing enzyme [Magnetospirillum sulfuroxidans]MBR9971802.1 hypothetical protein [Magnetospirillum sulfuroxidans]